MWKIYITVDLSLVVTIPNLQVNHLENTGTYMLEKYFCIKEYEWVIFWKYI